MREIKFRAWEENAPEQDLKFWSWSEMTDMVLDIFFNDYRNRFVLMQSTGLKDRDGKEIYEGDILRDSDTGNVKQVIYNAPPFVLVDEKRYFYWNYHADEYEVIGNIYENPELLAGVSHD